MAIGGIQSVDRSLEILRLVADRKRVTATELSDLLGIHQSSVSRHLKSLLEAGYVRKPDFHSFAPDFGILLFAGTAMKAFPLVESAAEVCAEISGKHGLGAAVAVLVNNRLVYLSWVSPGDRRSFHIVDDSDYPVFKSSMGLVLSYLEDRAAFRRNLLADKTIGQPAARRLFDRVDEQMSRHGYVHLQDFHGNRFNAAIAMNIPGTSQPAAFALFSTTKRMDEQSTGSLLKHAAEQIKKGT